MSVQGLSKITPVPCMQDDLLSALPATSEQAGWPWNEEVPPLPPLTPDGKPWPKITIVTPSYNQGQFIEETIRSVLLQNYPNLEYIIIDGGSTDQSVEVIKKYEPWLSYWVSEPDRGQPHAINKGFSMATGEIVQWINSDDLLTQGALVEVGRLANMFPEQLIGGGCEHFNEVEPVGTLFNQDLSAAKLVKYWQGGYMYQQPSLFVPRIAISSCGLIDESLHYCFDLDWTIRLLGLFQITYTKMTLARFRLHVNSKTVSQPERFESDCRVITQRYWKVEGAHGIEQSFWMYTLDRLLNSNLSRTDKLKKLSLGVFELPSRFLRRNTLGVLRRIVFSVS